MSRFTYAEFHFSSAHFYAQEAWSKSKNESEFGKCFYPNGHGHDYKVEVVFDGEKLSFEKAKSQVLDILDHHHLNHRVPEFKSRKQGGQGLIPTTENLAHFIWMQFFLLAPDVKLKSLRLYENADIWVELKADSYVLAK